MELEAVQVYCEARRSGYLKKGTNQIEYYGSISVIDETTDIECPICSELLNDYVEEE
mgnify:CR=1 FL=1